MLFRRGILGKISTAALSVLISVGLLFIMLPADEVLASVTANATVVNVQSYVNVRTSPTTSSSILGTLMLGARIYAGDAVAASSGDTSGCSTWYPVSYTSGGTDYNGYVASYYITKDPDDVASDPVFEASIAAFPDSYKPYLRSLHADHPNWVFNAVSVGYDWDTVLNSETENGVSLVQNTVDASWKSMASGAYDASSGTYTVVDSPNWVNASRAIVSYYMDPRNSLTDTGIFQYLDLSYTANSIDETAIQKVLNGTFMQSVTGTYIDGTQLYYKQMFALAGNISGVNPIFLAARVIQECGTAGSSSSSGTTGYYNFFNIGAYSNVYSASMVGLTFARLGTGDATFNAEYLIPWTTQGASLVGGAKWINDYYVDCGQNTVYFMRFNVSPERTTTLCRHQYMTATQSVSSESSRIFNAYNVSGMLDGALTFDIPVYNNMPDDAVPLPTSANAADEFISRAYVILFNREPSDSEKSNWSSQLTSGTEAVDILAQMVSSQEFVNRSLNDTEYINTIYELLLDRSPDSSGRNYMYAKINEGYSRKYLFSILANSSECLSFFDLYSVVRGTYLSDDPVDTNMQIKPFVESLYEGFFNRSYDVGGLRAWMYALATDSMTGQQVASCFFNSAEFQGLNLSDSEFITRIYRVCLDRDPDPAGLEYWMSQITAHHSRDFVFAGIINSEEFRDKCSEYGISSSSYSPSTVYYLVPNETQINAFVTRLYSLCLNRSPDSTGLSYWTSAIIDSGYTGYSVAYGFVFSDEMQSMNLSDEEYVTVLYHVFLNREPDSGGLTYWVNVLGEGGTRANVFEGFAYSDEYSQLCMDAGFYPNSSYLS